MKMEIKSIVASLILDARTVGIVEWRRAIIKKMVCKVLGNIAMDPPQHLVLDKSPTLIT